MTLSSTSTDAQVEAAYDDNSGWRSGSGDITAARAFQQACRMLLRRYASSMGADGASISRNVNLLENQLNEVTEWLSANDTDASGGGIVVLDLRDARS